MMRSSVWLGRRVSAQEQGSANGELEKSSTKARRRRRRRRRSLLSGPCLKALELATSSTLNNAFYRLDDLYHTGNLIEHLVCASLLGQDL